MGQITHVICTQRVLLICKPVIVSPSVSPRHSLELVFLGLPPACSASEMRTSLRCLPSGSLCFSTLLSFLSAWMMSAHKEAGRQTGAKCTLSLQNQGQMSFRIQALTHTSTGLVLCDEIMLKTHTQVALWFLETNANDSRENKNPEEQRALHSKVCFSSSHARQVTLAKAWLRVSVLLACCHLHIS